MISAYNLCYDMYIYHNVHLAGGDQAKQSKFFISSMHMQILINQNSVHKNVLFIFDKKIGINPNNNNSISVVYGWPFNPYGFGHFCVCSISHTYIIYIFNINSYYYIIIIFYNNLIWFNAEMLSQNRIYCRYLDFDPF